MLFLTRRVGERIFIGEDVIIEVMGVSRAHGVSLGVSAPRTLTIDREEVHSRKVKERGATTPRALVR